MDFSLYTFSYGRFVYVFCVNRLFCIYFCLTKVISLTMGQIGTYDPVWLNKLNYFLLIKWDKKLLKNQHQTPAVCILIIERFFFFFSLSDRNVIFEIYSMPYISTSNNVCMNNDFCQPGKGSLIGEILHIAELREFGDSFFFSWSCCEKGVTLSTSKSPK